MIEIPLRRLDPALPVPAYAHEHDAGADLPAARSCVIPPGCRRMVPTGVAVAIPEGFVGLVHPRSGLAARYGLTIVNAPGTIDAGYTGEIKVCLLNTDRSRPVRLRRGDAIAQLVVQPVVRAEFAIVEQLPATARGRGGYGSTGRAAALAADEEKG
ncbi:MAG: dUTP diphosphatase [Propionibacteriaceae bacterium]|nr:dUTP diphosphatase [Propionibacteriaceae bacterium]